MKNDLNLVVIPSNTPYGHALEVLFPICFVFCFRKAYWRRQDSQTRFNPELKCNKLYLSEARISFNIRPLGCFICHASSFWGCVHWTGYSLRRHLTRDNISNIFSYIYRDILSFFIILLQQIYIFHVYLFGTHYKAVLYYWNSIQLFSFSILFLKNNPIKA